MLRTIDASADTTLTIYDLNAQIEVAAGAAVAITLPAPSHIINDGDVITVRKASGAYNVTVQADEVLTSAGDTVSYFWKKATWTWTKFAETRQGAPFPAVGTAAGEAALLFGRTVAEGLMIKVIEESVVHAANNAALHKALTTPIPAGAVILCAQANLETAITGGSTTVKVGLGPNASDPDKYGKTSALTVNAKISTIPDWAVLGSEEAIDICACASAGGAGDTALTSGTVRVRIVYLVAANLANAA